MKPLFLLTSREVEPVRYVCTDIDDTLTRDGGLCQSAFEALWQLREAGLKIIPVTGRPAGWCDCIVRQWPIDGIVGENGAFAYFLENGTRQTLVHANVRGDGSTKERLDEIKAAVLTEVPGVLISKDQPFRLYDLAVDFAEDSTAGLNAAYRVEEIAKRFGAEVKISSIHVNIWFGSYHKLSMTTQLLGRLWGESMETCKVRTAYCGDSLNDEPMFAFFPLSFGMKNITPFTNRMKSTPAYIAPKGYGEGFAAVSSLLTMLKKKK